MLKKHIKPYYEKPLLFIFGGMVSPQSKSKFTKVTNKIIALSQPINETE
jgi:hypothetical protein